MINRVTLVGRLGRAPELKSTQSGVPVVIMSVATDEGFTDRQGNKIDRTEWHRVVAFNRLAQSCSTYLGKGSLVYVEGSLQTRRWEDSEGTSHVVTEIKTHKVRFLSRKQEGTGADSATPSATQHSEGVKPPEFLGQYDFEPGEFSAKSTEPFEEVPF